MKRHATVTIHGISPIGFGKAVEPKQRDESHEDYEERIWKDRCHFDKKGDIFIPPTALKNCICDAAKYKAIQIPGKGKTTYTKHFEAGTMCIEPMYIGITLKELQRERLFVPADGKPGGGKRVWKTFPVVHEWSGTTTYILLDDIITNEVFETHLRDAGQFIGLGRFRPRNRGFYGRFVVDKLEWTSV